MLFDRGEHVLDPLFGYIVLAEKLISSDENFAEAWNFGPEELGAKTVSWVLEGFLKNS